MNNNFTMYSVGATSYNAKNNSSVSQKNMKSATGNYSSNSTALNTNSNKNINHHSLTTVAGTTEMQTINS